MENIFKIFDDYFHENPLNLYHDEYDSWLDKFPYDEIYEEIVHSSFRERVHIQADDGDDYCSCGRSEWLCICDDEDIDLNESYPLLCGNLLPVRYFHLPKKER